LSTSSVTLETWKSGSWHAVKSFTGLKGGSSQILQVKGSCPPYQLPNYASRWTHVVGLNMDASDGDERTVECIDGSTRATVICSHGTWTNLPLISCFQPSIPSLGSTSSSKKNAGSLELSTGVEMILWLIGCVIGVAVFLVAVYSARRWWQQYSWKRFLREGPWEGGIPSAEDVNRQPVDWAKELRDSVKQGKSAAIFPSSASHGRQGKMSTSQGRTQKQALGSNKFRRMPSDHSDDFETHNLANPRMEKPRVFHGPPAEFTPMDSRNQPQTTTQPNPNRTKNKGLHAVFAPQTSNVPPVPPPPLPSMPPGQNAGGRGNLWNSAYAADHEASSPSISHRPELSPQRNQRNKPAVHESPGQRIGNQGNLRSAANAVTSVSSPNVYRPEFTPQRNQRNQLAPQGSPEFSGQDSHQRGPSPIGQAGLGLRVTGQSWRSSRTPQPGPTTSPLGLE